MNRLPCITVGLLLAGTLLAGISGSSGSPLAQSLNGEPISFPLTLQWKFSSVDVGGALPSRNIPTAPIIDGNVVYVCARGLTTEKVPTTSVYALSLDTGEKLWNRLLEGAVFGTPALADGTLWVADTKGYLYALDVRDGGREKSRFQLALGSRCTPVLHDGVVYLGDDGGVVVAIDTKTLQERWRFQAKGPVKAQVAISPENKYLYVCSGEPRLHVLQLETGVQVWDYPMPEKSMDSAPLLWGGNLYVVSGKRMLCMTASRGRAKWDSAMMKVTTGYQIIGTPALVADDAGKNAAIFFCCEDGTVNALDAASGRMWWKSPVKLDRIPTCSPVVTRDALLIGGQTGMLYALKLDGSKLVWKYRMVPPADISAQTDAISISSPPLAADGRVLALADEGTLLCFTPDAIDNSPPQVTDIQVRGGPIEDQVPVYGMPPLPFTAKVSDEGSGFDEAKLVFKLDGKRVPHEFAAKTGEITYRTRVTQPIRALADGTHTVSITVADWKGNSSTQEWVFRVDHRRMPVAPKPQPTGGAGGMGAMPGMPQ